MKKAVLCMAILSVVIVFTNQPVAGEQYQLQDGTWQEQGVVDRQSPEGKLMEARRVFAQGDVGAAKELADTWIENNPNHPLLVEAYLIRGDALMADGEYFDALFEYEHVLREFPGSDQFNTALNREFEIAVLFSKGTKRKLLGIPMVSAYGEAEEIFIRIQERTPGSSVGERASLMLGDHYYRRGDMNSAAIAYDMFLKNYPRSPHRQGAMYKHIQSTLGAFNGPRFDATSLVEASQRLRDYQREFPAAAQEQGTAALLNQAEESMAKNYFSVGSYYTKRGDRVSAAYMYRRLIREYPSSEAAKDAAAILEQWGLPVVTEAADSKSGPPPRQEALP